MKTLKPTPRYTPMPAYPNIRENDIVSLLIVLAIATLVCFTCWPWR